jgi:hypothetical protein
MKRRAILLMAAIAVELVLSSGVALALNVVDCEEGLGEHTVLS